jgi:hypothetical protein
MIYLFHRGSQFDFSFKSNYQLPENLFAENELAGAGDLVSVVSDALTTTNLITTPDCFTFLLYCFNNLMHFGNVI